MGTTECSVGSGGRGGVWIALLEDGVVGDECIELERERVKNLVAGDETRGSDDSGSVVRGEADSRASGEGVEGWEGTKAGMSTGAALAPGELSCRGKDELRIERELPVAGKLTIPIALRPRRVALRCDQAGSTGEARDWARSPVKKKCGPVLIPGEGDWRRLRVRNEERRSGRGDGQRRESAGEGASVRIESIR